MDLNIDDILADLDRDTTAVDSSLYLSSEHDTTRFSEANGTPSNHEKHIAVNNITPESDYQMLITHWRNERMAPELLPYPHLLIGRLLQRLTNQIEHIENLSMGFLEEAAENDAKIPMLCMEAELERLKFVIRSYIRCRLHKIDKYSLYLRQLDQANDRTLSLTELLSPQEMVYHDKHSKILLKLFNNSVLRHMPPEMQAIDDTDGSINMIDQPDWSKFVFVLIKGAEPGEEDSEQVLNDDGKPCYSVTIPDLNEEVELAVGGIYVMRYNVISGLLRDGKAILV
ncbi:HEL338Wp [Eremothecium sinecaudum]|uniref:DNA replication complex GINS protein SLD5 n=1 Tax=Eremothecium sinecaudum TaxID=45286 RepID=A0A109UZK4_9SACH|nr:HEL338Wp [Eremothecium sinecaudum]AMD20943.1 HEL338Wp [Eremothecium sinecaudum]